MLFDENGQEGRIGSCKHYSWFDALFKADFEKAKNLFEPDFFKYVPYPDSGVTPLSYAISHKWDDVILFLSEHDPDFQARLRKLCHEERLYLQERFTYKEQ